MTGWPQTYNGVEFTEADFAGNRYADSLPRLLAALGQHVAQFSKSPSTTSILVASSGDITIAVYPNKNYAEGHPIRIARTSDPANVWMTGACISYDVSTGIMVVRRSASAGAGTHTDWTVSVDGGSGPAGGLGLTGPMPVTFTTSTASLTPALGSTGSFACAAAIDLGLGSDVVIADQAAPTTKWMHGKLTAKSGVNITVLVSRFEGSGAGTSWYVALSGPQGITGDQGVRGNDGRVPGLSIPALRRAIRRSNFNAIRL